MHAETVSTDRIEKQIELKAPMSRVWRAIADHLEFGEWFRTRVDAPFVVGQTVRGQVLHPGYEHVTVLITPAEIVPETLFSYRWHPHALDMTVDYSSESQTLVEFRLEPSADGTLLKISESGFDALPDHRRETAFRGNSNGWAGQTRNIERYVAGNP